MSYNSRIDRLDKNYLINGGFDFYQRAGATVAVNTTTSSAYSGPDRWRVFHAGTFTGTPNIVRSTVIPSNNITQYSNNWAFRRNASTASLTYEQRIEARNCQELFAAGKMSLSFFINSTVAPSGTQVNVTLLSANATDNFASMTTQYTSFALVPTANTWQEVKFENLSVFAAMLNGMAVRIEFSYPSGTDASIQNAYLAQVMLNASSSASVFARSGRNYNDELALCQRYFEKSYDLEVVPGLTGNGNCYGVSASTGAGGVWMPIYYASQKRIIPAITIYNSLTGAVGTMDRGGTPIAAGLASSATRSATIVNSVATVLASGHGAHFTADAEL